MKAPKMTVVMSTMRGASRPTKSKDHRVKAMRVIASRPPKARCQRRSLLRPTAGGGVWRSGARTWVIRSPSEFQSMWQCLSASMIRRPNDRQVTGKVNGRLTPIPRLTKCSCTVGTFCLPFTQCSRSGAMSAGFRWRVNTGAPRTESRVVTMTTSARNERMKEPGSAYLRIRARSKCEKLAEAAGISR